MRRSVLLCLTLVTMIACRGDDVTGPNMTDASSPSYSISDGNHCATPGLACVKGNPDFFWLLPLVPDPRGTANWNAGAANPNLSVSVDICQLSATSEAEIKANANGAACKAGGYTLSTTVGSKNISFGPLDDADLDALKFFVTHYTSFGEPYYHFGWTVPVRTVSSTAPPTFFRVKASVGTKLLGYLDFEQPNSLRQLLNVHTGEFVPLIGGIKLPINFRVEQFALCSQPGVGPCTTVSGDIAAAPLTVTTGGAEPSGVTIPVQPGLPPTKVTVTLQPCDDFRGVLNGRAAVTDLPTFGPCNRVTVDPALSAPLTNPALVFSCAVNLSVGGVAGSAQARRIALHELNEQSSSPILRALPQADPSCPNVPPVIGLAPSLREMMVALAHGRVKSAATQMVAMLAPKPLYAARFIDLGGGGFSPLGDAAAAPATSVSIAGGARLSVAAAAAPSVTIRDFQFALPSRFEVAVTPANPYGIAGSTVALSVTVSDLAGQPVQNARVHFQASEGSSVGAGVVNTTSTGKATVQWTLSSTAGTNTLVASGNGIAGPNEGGASRPFQPLQIHWGDAVNDQTPVVVLPGSLTVRIIGVATTTVCSDANVSLVAAPEGGVPRPASVVSPLDPFWGSALGGSQTIAGSSWISGLTSGGQSAPLGTYVYEMKFDAAPGMLLSGSIMFDDTADITLNGTSVSIAGGDLWRAPGSFSSSSLVGGTNTLSIASINTGGPGGVDFCFSTTVPSP